MNEAVIDKHNADGTLDTRERSSYEYDMRSFRVGQLIEDWNEATSQFDFKSDTEFLVSHRNHTGYAQTLRETTTNADGSTKTIDYTFGHDEIAQRVVERDDQGNVTSDETHVFGHDGHGSVRVLYDVAAAGESLISQIATYSAYGVMIAMHSGNSTASPITEFKSTLTYSGEAWDNTLNKGYNRARWYDASSGQWNRLDPFSGNMQDPQSLHKYAYVHGDPIQGTDPTGRFIATATLGAIGLSAKLRGKSAGVNLTAGKFAAAFAFDLAFISAFTYFGVRRHSPRDLREQLPVEGRQVWSNITRVKVIDSDLTAGEFFERFAEFRDEDFAANTVASVKKFSQDGNNYMTFDFDHVLEIGQADFDVRIQEFDRASRFMSVVTLQGHPLSGFRYFRVIAGNDSDTTYEIETAAVDHPTLWNDSLFKMYPDYILDFFNLGQLTETWIDSFQTLAENTNATWQVTDDRWISKFDSEFEQTKTLVNWRTQDDPR